MRANAVNLSFLFTFILIISVCCVSSNRNSIVVDVESLPEHEVTSRFDTDGNELFIVVEIYSQLDINQINSLGNYLAGDGKRDQPAGGKKKYDAVRIYYDYKDPENKVWYENNTYAASYRKYSQSDRVNSKIFEPWKPSGSLLPSSTYAESRAGAGNVVGKWYDRTFKAVYTIYTKSGFTYLEILFPDSSSLHERLEVKTRNGRRTYNVAGDDYEYFYIGGDGLYVYDTYGSLGMRLDIY